MSVYSLRDFGVEYAKSGRAVCRKCNEAIAKVCSASHFLVGIDRLRECNQFACAEISARKEDHLRLGCGHAIRGRTAVVPFGVLCRRSPHAGLAGRRPTAARTGRFAPIGSAVCVQINNVSMVLAIPMQFHNILMHRPMVIKSDERIEAKQETKPITAARLAAIRAQTERYFGNRDYCHRHLTKREMVTILRSNRQDAPKTLHGVSILAVNNL